MKFRRDSLLYKAFPLFAGRGERALGPVFSHLPYRLIGSRFPTSLPRFQAMEIHA